MKVFCDKTALKEAVILVERMTGKQLSLPTLKGILFNTTENALILRATNLAVGIEVTIPAKIEHKGQVVLRGDVLSSVLSNIREKEVVLSLEHENLLITTASSQNIIKALPNDEFPTLPNIEGNECIIDQQVLIDGIRGVFFAAATTDIKPEISSVFIYSENNYLVFVATDSFRLAEKKIKIKHALDIPKLLLPYKNIPDILKTLESVKGVVTLTFDTHQLSLRTNTVYFTTRLIDGGFPDYRLIIPKEEKTKIVLLRQDLLSTLRLSTMFVDTFSQLTLSVIPQEKKVILVSTNNDVGKSQSLLDAVITGPAIEVVCNSKYLLDVFQSIEDDSISFSFTESNKAILMRGVHDTSFIYLLMPSKR